MAHYALRRGATVVPVLLGVSLLVFAFIHMIPGDPDNFLCYFFCQPGAAREGFYGNKPLADVLLRAQKLTQQSERAKLYRQAEQLLRDDVGRLFIANNQPPLAFAKRVKGYVPHPTGSEYFNTVEMQ